MPSGCTPENVMGKLAASLEAKGKAVDGDYVVNSLGVSGKAEYNRTRNHAGADSYDTGPNNPADEKSVKPWEAFADMLGNPIHTVKTIVNEHRNPSGLFGEERVRPVVDFITNHYKEYKAAIENGAGEYHKGIKKVFDGIDTSGLSPQRQGDWEHYRRFYEGGGELYSKNKAPFGGVLSNLAGNTIQSSSTVLLGNVTEGAIKLPALYPTTFIQGIAKAASKGAFFKIPELEELGLYGRKYEGKDAAPFWEKAGTLIEATDVPLKNALFYAGEFKGGVSEGLKAVQKGAFLPRFGDLPSIYYTSAGRNDVRFLSYTINTYKMYGAAVKGLTEGTLAQRTHSAYTLAALVGLPFLIGGAAGATPKPIVDLISTFDPDTAAKIEESVTPFSNLIQVGGIGRVAIVASIAEQRAKKAWSLFQDGVERIKDGETKNGTLDLVDSMFEMTSFLKTPLGDAQLHKLLRIGKEVAQDEFDEDLVDRVVKDLKLPTAVGE